VPRDIGVPGRPAESWEVFGGDVDATDFLTLSERKDMSRDTGRVVSELPLVPADRLVPRRMSRGNGVGDRREVEVDACPHEFATPPFRVSA
jgi:hypothetical protein